MVHLDLHFLEQHNLGAAAAAAAAVCQMAVQFLLLPLPFYNLEVALVLYQFLHLRKAIWSLVLEWETFQRQVAPTTLCSPHHRAVAVTKMELRRAQRQLRQLSTTTERSLRFTSVTLKGSCSTAMMLVSAAQRNGYRHIPDISSNAVPSFSLDAGD
jgi:hypothetical protein